jgi:hypothetical protein
MASLSVIIGAPSWTDTLDDDGTMWDVFKMVHAISIADIYISKVSI